MSMLLAYSLKSSFLNNKPYSHFNNNLINIKGGHASSDNFENFSFSHMKDLYVSISESDLLTEDNLKIFEQITNSVVSEKNINYFEYFNDARNVPPFNIYNFRKSAPSNINL
jgi:hypothetical protein